MNKDQAERIARIAALSLSSGQENALIAIRLRFQAADHYDTKAKQFDHTSPTLAETYAAMALDCREQAEFGLFILELSQGLRVQ